jgi:cysteine-rich repeat protein
MNLGAMNCQACARGCKVCTSPFVKDCTQCIKTYTSTTVTLQKCGYCEDEAGVYSLDAICVNKCGDGILREEFKEYCDDENTNVGDGCS